jgi:hypothetical protein
MGCEREQNQTNLRVLIRFVLQLSVGEERMKNSKVGVTTLYALDYQSGSKQLYLIGNSRLRFLPADPPTLARRHQPTRADRSYRNILVYQQ